jgi:beta-mannosidase
MPHSTDRSATGAPSSRGHVEGHELLSLSDGWQASASSPDAQMEAAEGLSWLPARVPGTAAAVLADAGLWQAGEAHDFDAEDWWFRCEFAAQPAAPGEEVLLRLDGIATVAEVYLNGQLILTSDSMFAAYAIDVGHLLRSSNDLAICCRALAPLLSVSRKPRARWRTRLVSDGALRFFRTRLLGRTHTSGPVAVGPWRPVRLERRRSVVLEELTLRPRMDGPDGLLSVAVRLRALGEPLPTDVAVELSGDSGTHVVALTFEDVGEHDTEEVRASGELRVAQVTRWWPHTHGEPQLHSVRLLLDGERRLSIDAGRVGFRELRFGSGDEHDLEREGLDLHVNGTRVFVRGALWTGAENIGMSPTETQLREELERVREAGMNMLRLPGTGTYESDTFHDLCDELGILVWQDFMFANLDYPISVEGFRDTLEREVTSELDRLGGHPSLVVLCGNSEIEQQVAMLGMDPVLGRGELFGELLPSWVSESGVDALYVPSAPCGGELPFRPDRGVANYYGVGGYRRPLEDARRAGVLFAAECLAFSNIPNEPEIERMAGAAPGDDLVGHHPAWKAGIPRDAGADWDFEDVRDHYLELLYGVEVRELRRVDRHRYMQLSRALTGEVMAEVFGEWRRASSPCRGALVLWLRDLTPGAGWGLIGHDGEAKLAYHHLRRALAPVAVWTVDEGLGGVVAHVANDRSTPLRATLRVALYRDREQRVAQERVPVELDPHSQAEWNVETVVGHFLDASWAYRFGPPAQDAIVVSLSREDNEGESLLSQSMRFPTGPPIMQESPERLGLLARARPMEDGGVSVTLSCRRLAYGVRLHMPGFRPADDGFSLEPGVERTVTLHPREADSALGAGKLSAVNMLGQLNITREELPG